MHFWRNFSGKILEAKRLVFAFRASGDRALDAASGGPDKIVETGKVEKRQGVKDDSTAKREDLKEEIDETGEAEKYIETFQKQPQFDAVSHLLKEGMDHEGNESAFNFNNWLIMDSKLVAKVFDIEFMPHGKGRLSFLDGLENPDQTSEEFKKSQAILKQLVDVLKKRFDERQGMQEDAQKEKEKPAVGETIGDGVKTLMRNFKRASGTEKALILGAIGIGISLLWKWKDKAIFKDFTFGDAAKWAGALWGLNYLSGKVSKDGKTLIQRADVALDIEDLKDENRLKGYGYEHGLDKDQEKYHAFLELQNKDVRQLYQAYKEVSGPGVKKEIDPKRLGIYNEAVDGKSVYEVVDDLVKETSVNLHTEQRRADAEQNGIPYNEKADLSNNGLIDLWTSPSEAQAKFEEKYFGLLKDANVTLIAAILNEYQGDSQAAIASGRQRRRWEKAKKTTADVLEKTWGYTKKYAAVAGAFVYKYGGKAINFTNNKILKPAGRWIASEWNHYSPYVKDKIRDVVSYSQEKDLNKVLPPEFDVDVLKPGQAKIMGLAGIPSEVKTGQDAAGHNREVAEIDGIKFIIDDGITGNAANATALETKIKQKVDAFVKAKNIPQFAGITPRWDGTNKKWLMDNVPVGADAFGITPGGNIPVEVKIDDDATTLHFFDGSKEIANLSDLTTEHMHAALEEEIWKAVPNLEPIVKGLSVTIDGAVTGTPAQQSFKANFGGLEFEVLRTAPAAAGSAPTYEYVETPPGGGSPVTHPLNQLKIEEAIGGKKFLDTLGKQIFQSDDYKENYLLLEAEMENTKEGFAQRMKELAKTKLWILPTNLDGAINGKILQEQWRYTLQFKMFETIQIFKDECKGQQIDQIPLVYQDVVVKANQHLKDLLDTIRSYSDTDKANEFQNFLSGKPRIVLTASGASVTLPAGLEYVNYENQDYRDAFEKYQAVITNPRYDYEGFDNYDVGGESAHETYLTMLLVWSRHTQTLRDKPGPLTATEKADLQFVTDKVQDKLEKAKLAGGATGTIKKENLPAGGKNDDTSLKEWMK